MKTVLIFGAGKSATILIEYLCVVCKKNNWRLIVCDADLELAQSKINDCINAEAISINVSNAQKRCDLICKSDIVISMLPPHLHFLVATDCLQFSKHLLTASYVDENIKKLEKEILDKGLLFLCEMGLDPGIDHMSAMKIIDEIKNNGGKIISFRSHCGGLISPESDDNPWHYKITWNPANIVMAGSSGAIYKENGKISELLYKDIFKNNDLVNIPALYPLAWYANRDSLSYIDIYNLQDVQTFMRTTLRHPSFCSGWNAIVNMNLTNVDDYSQIKNCKTYQEWYQLKKNTSGFIFKDEKAEKDFGKQITFLGINSDIKINDDLKNSATLLQRILEEKLIIKPEDRDMIVMLHEIEYEQANQKKKISSYLLVKGENNKHTAMAKTVGLPLGIAAKLILEGEIHLTGLHIPVIKGIYDPVLAELSSHEITFNEILSDIR